MNQIPTMSLGWTQLKIWLIPTQVELAVNLRWTSDELV